MKKSVVPCFLCFLICAACVPQNKTQKGALYGTAGGAGAGAVIGQAIGHDTEATIIGAAIGAAVGGLAGAGAGKMMDNQERELRQAIADSEAAAVRREGNLLAVSLKGDITFDTNSAIVKPGLYSEIERISSVLAQYKKTVIRVEGHTDSVGSESYNMDLSKQRAEAIKNLIIERGIHPARVEITAYGESKPVATNETEAGRMLNRRVEIKVAPTQY